ncbi:MAG: hypothetical protein AMXMBFR74_33570 [Parvibaculum sp.]|jgi:hypothetical protein|uniref:class I SAM-dependent methyltransferase n=1 Tax=Parvibaculum sp. TaxID=2024848 RepID=UPI0035B97516
MLMALMLASVCATARAEKGAPPDDSQCLKTMRTEADAARPLVQSPLAKGFLDAAARLAIPSARDLYRTADKRYVMPDEAAKLSDRQRADLTKTPVTAQIYYHTKYGTPLAYVRLLDLLGQAGIKDVRGKRVLDYGYGTVGHLRMLASMGADAVGVDVDPFLPALYCKEDDQGKIAVDGKDVGLVTLVNGRWPGDADASKRVGGGYDLIISKNTLKNGYLHPEREVDSRMLIDLGVSEDKFVARLYAALKPGGYVMIYNICPAPAPADKPYIPWADGRCPFPRKMLESAGFKIIEFDRDDSKAVREMAHAFGWDSGDYKMELETNLFAHYTLLRRLE